MRKNGKNHKCINIVFIAIALAIEKLSLDIILCHILTKRKGWSVLLYKILDNIISKDSFSRKYN